MTIDISRLSPEKRAFLKDELERLNPRLNPEGAKKR